MIIRYTPCKLVNHEQTKTCNNLIWYQSLTTNTREEYDIINKNNTNHRTHSTKTRGTPGMITGTMERRGIDDLYQRIRETVRNEEPEPVNVDDTIREITRIIDDMIGRETWSNDLPRETINEIIIDLEILSRMAATRCDNELIDDAITLTRLVTLALTTEKWMINEIPRLIRDKITSNIRTVETRHKICISRLRVLINDIGNLRNIVFR